MKVAYSAIAEVKEAKPQNRVPMYQDPVLKAEMRNWFIAQNNKRVLAKKQA